MKNLNGKRLLVLGGASQHCKIVEAAKEMGIITYVVDNLPSAPAKEMADYSYQINVTETDVLVQLCKNEKIDGIIAGWLDFCQKPYQKLCEAAGLPCYGTWEQFDLLTRKANFKKICEEYGVGQPTNFHYEDYLNKEENEKLPYPLFVKPSDSRGSRGSGVCYTCGDLVKAIEIAKKESYDGKAVAEKYITDSKMFLAVYLFVNGEPYLQQLSDAYFGDSKYGQQKINVVYKSPSVYADTYMKLADASMKRMLKGIGIKNGPVCFQGFINENEVMFYDPGRRFPGGEYERAFKVATGIDVVKEMIVFALSGKMQVTPDLEKDTFDLCGKHIMRLQLNVVGGEVAEEVGFDLIRELPGVEYVAMYHEVGDVIDNTGDVRQRYSQVVFVSDTLEELKRTVNQVYSLIHVYNTKHEEMLVPAFNTSLL